MSCYLVIDQPFQRMSVGIVIGTTKVHAIERAIPRACRWAAHIRCCQIVEPADNGRPHKGCAGQVATNALQPEEHMLVYSADAAAIHARVLAYI